MDLPYQQYFDAMPCYLTVQDRDFKVVTANRQFREAFYEVFQARAATVRDRYAKQIKGGHRYEEVSLQHSGIEESCSLPWVPVGRAGSRHYTGVDDREDMKVEICDKRIGGDHDACWVGECDTKLVT